MLLLSGTASAAGGADAGKSRRTVQDVRGLPRSGRQCGHQSRSIRAWPVSTHDYLARSLQEYKSDDRQNAIMKGFAKTLTEADIDDLAAYYSSHAGKARPICTDTSAASDSPRNLTSQRSALADSPPTIVRICAGRVIGRIATPT